MFLKKIICLCSVLFTTASMSQAMVPRESQLADDIVGSQFLQVGVDAWRINTSAKEDTKANMNSLSRLQLANSYPAWSSFSDVSPWLRYEGGIRVGQDTLLTLKYRSDQSTGSRLDEASLDRSFHIYGMRLGVLDPKISWCRTYDIDSPWVRENNPFCSIQPLNFARGSAPGGQVYANFIAGEYSVQTIAGVYRPLWFNYASNESPTITLPANSTITQHVKSGLAMSATNLRNGMELRVGVLQDQFTSNRYSINQSVPYNNDVRSDVLFVGANWYATSKIALRMTYFTYTGHWKQTMRDTVNYVSFDQDSRYKATSLESNYQMNARDVLSAAYVVYDFNANPTEYALQAGSPVLVSTYSGAPHFVTTNASLSWRRDWGAGLFTVLQLSKANTDQRDSSNNKQISSEGQAIGLRLGYRF
jgi:hypothetical protein